VGLSHGEIAAVEQVSPNTISTRLDRARRGVMGDNSDLLTGVIELPGVVLDNDRGYVDEMSLPAEARGEQLGAAAGHLDDRWERANTWNGGPDGSWIVSEAPPWDAPNADEWPRTTGSDRWGVGGTHPRPTSGNDPSRDTDDRSWDGVSGGPIDDGEPVISTDPTPGDRAGSDVPASLDDDGRSVLDGTVGSNFAGSTEDTPRNDSEDRR